MKMIINLFDDLPKYSTNIRIASLISSLKKIKNVIENSINSDNETVLISSLNVLLKSFSIEIKNVNLKNDNKRIKKKKIKKLISEIEQSIVFLNSLYTFS